MSGLRDELKEMSRGFRWGRRPLVPRSAEPYTERKESAGFPTDWARTQAGTAARQAILKGLMHPLIKNELSLRVHGQRMSNGPCFRDASTYISPPHESGRTQKRHRVRLATPQISTRSAKLGVGPRPNVIACMVAERVGLVQ